MDSQIEKTIQFDRIEQIINIFGSFDENVKVIEEAFSVKIINRDEEIKILGQAEQFPPSKSLQ